jgi:DNA-binding transcriptional ArsR family regulator
LWHIQTVLETFAALADPNRFRIVELLRSGPRPVNDIGDRLRLNQPQVSKHLRVLKEAGLVDVEPRAQQRLYELRAPPLRRLHDWLERYRDLWDARFEELDELIEELKANEKSDGQSKQKSKKKASPHR